MSCEFTNDQKKCKIDFENMMDLCSRLFAHSSLLPAHDSRLTTHGSQLLAHDSQLKAHSSRLTAHSSQLTAHSSHLPINIQQSIRNVYIEQPIFLICF
jgi:hypothetical protein